jgi:hypothetical protein
MRSAADFAQERERMASFRKEANLASMAEYAAKGAVGLGKGLAGAGKAIWEGAKTLGGGSATKMLTTPAIKNIGLPAIELPVSQRAMRGGAILGTGAMLGAGVPSVVGGAMQQKKEMMTPWQGRGISL